MADNATTAFNIGVTSMYDFEQTLDRLRQSIQAEGLLLLHEINTQQIVKAHGVEIDGLCQLLFFHPRYIKTILELNSSAVVEAPLKLVVLETALKGATVRYIQPDHLFGRYTALEELGSELNNIIAKITAAVTH